MSKIDRLVGFKVFGWELRLDKDGAEVWYTEQANAFEKQYDCSPIVHGPNFATEIAAAWEVVEHLRKQRSAYDAPTDPTWRVSLTGSGDRWICDVADWRERLDVSACDKDPRVAICWAALRAFKVSESEIQEAMR